MNQLELGGRLQLLHSSQRLRRSSEQPIQDNLHFVALLQNFLVKFILFLKTLNDRIYESTNDFGLLL